MTDSTVSESSVRNLANRRGYRVCKSRQREHLNNHGLFQLVDNSRNMVILGSNFDASLGEIREYLSSK